ncbi:hypothetical protein PBI_HOWE_63 [Gordonia phage Howe]|uniref:Uncharacterized protein n=2 Tax=Caudoviricetes TaxID=2731619 RepID=A0A0U4JHG0_9CAUD|nr:hypothetical protein PP513_gp63 [Gordonia phage Howe]AZF93248.1 hypothetical protein SEA_ADORA_60 [Gordonia phage Adora]QDF16843.1 hypothetical protein SEA_TWINKLE_62 [Gordonia phage Twinkle]QYC54462.1 membrane protein [Gordonia phage Shlim410]UAJ16312.1 hypothetical protein SEA_HORTENSE_63 [Gordonia phage Hortense]URM87957.1 hypothetical protein SEA_WINKNICK_61 [Gordonia phage WinkNick]
MSDDVRADALRDLESDRAFLDGTSPFAAPGAGFPPRGGGVSERRRFVMGRLLDTTVLGALWITLTPIRVGIPLVGRFVMPFRYPFTGCDDE